MSKHKPPLLINFFSISDGHAIILGGQIIYSKRGDIEYETLNRWQTAKNLIRLYRAKPLKNKTLHLLFDEKKHTTAKTDGRGFFYINKLVDGSITNLDAIHLKDGTIVQLAQHIQTLHTQPFTSKHLLISDLDDTLIQSFIRNKFKKIWTMLFTRVTKRKSVKDIQKLVNYTKAQGSDIVYLSNSEQNLGLLISSFLAHNQLPEGPIFLKKFRGTIDLLLNKKVPEGETHKLETLRELLRTFPTKQHILVGDNTQHDLEIYLTVANEFPSQIKHIIIREVYPQPEDKTTISSHEFFLKEHQIQLHYAPSFEEVLFDEGYFTV